MTVGALAAPLVPQRLGVGSGHCINGLEYHIHADRTGQCHTPLEPCLDDWYYPDAASRGRRLQQPQRLNGCCSVFGQFVENDEHIFARISAKHGLVHIGIDPNFKVGAKSKKGDRSRAAGI